MSKTLDESVAENTQLTADLNTAKQTIGTLQGEITSLKAEKNTLATQLESAKSSAVTLQTNLNTVTGERDALTGEIAALKTSVDAKVAAALAKHGVRPEAVAAEASDPQKSTLTLTEQCRLANPKTAGK